VTRTNIREADSGGQSRRSGLGFLAGMVIGTLGGLIGLGGAEFRLPVLVGAFRLATLEAVILNKAISLVVVAAALFVRSGTIPFDQISQHWEPVLNLLAGSLAGAWWAAGHAVTMPRRWLNRIVLVLLAGLAVLMLAEAGLGLHDTAAPLFEATALQIRAGLLAGFGIGAVAALLGVAGGELLIPTIVLLYALDIKLAGSLSLAVSLPTMLVGFARYRAATAFSVLREEHRLLLWMAAGSVLGVGLGGLLLAAVPARSLTALLGLVLLISAVKTFQHAD